MTRELTPARPVYDASETASVDRGRFRSNPWWVLTVLSILYCVAAIDQGGLPLVVNPIKADLGLSDVQISFLMGFSLTAIQCTLILPAGFLTDRFNRRNMIAASVVLWSSVASLMGFATSFAQLFLARSALSASNVVLHPAANSMVRDAFPPERRGMAFSILTANNNISLALSLLISGALIAASGHGAFRAWPVIGHFKTWQLVLAFPALCSFPLALLTLTMREPRRLASQVIRNDSVTTRDAIRYVWSHRWVYLPFFIAVIFDTYPYGALAWMPTALIRGWDLPAAEIADVLGTIGLVAALSGMLLSGWIMDVLNRRGIADGPLRLFVIGNAVSQCCIIAVLHVHQAWLAYGLLGLGQFFGACRFAAFSLTVAYITPSRLMGRIFALYTVTFTLLGHSLAPTWIALVAKYGFTGPLALIPALNLYLAVTVPLALALMLFAVSRVARFSRTYAGREA